MAAWSLATEICSCDEPIARGWRFCVGCGSATAVSVRGRSVKVSPDQVSAWFEDLLPVELRVGETTSETSVVVEPAATEADAAHVRITVDTTSAADDRPLTVPPPPGGGYTSAALAAASAQRMLLGAGLVSFVAAGTMLVLNMRLRSFRDGDAEAFDAAVSVGRLADYGTRPLVVIAIAMAWWLLIRWAEIVYGNVASFGRTNQRLPPESVRWSFMIPVVNLITPRRLINDAFRAAGDARTAGRDWLNLPGNVWTTAAWSFGLVALGAHLVGWWLGSATVDAAVAANDWAMLGYLAQVGATAASGKMIQQVTDRQEHRRAALTGQTQRTGTLPTG